MNKEYNPGKDSAEERKENHGETQIRQDDFLRNTILRYAAMRELFRVIYMLMFATPWFRHLRGV